MAGSLKLKERLDAGLPNTSPRPDTSEPPQAGMESLPSPDDWLISIKKNLEVARQYDAAGSRRNVSIYRVPHWLRDPLREKAYIPQVVSLGPYHHGSMLLQPMELHKWRALDNILQRNNQSIELYLDSMKKLENRARACYEGPIKLSSNQFVEMMVLHGCFILELFQGATEPDGFENGFEKLGYARDDPLFSIQSIEKIESIRREMIMLENQIPFIVLSKLYELQSNLPEDEAERKVARLAIKFLKPLLKTVEPSTRIDITKPSTRDSTTSDPQSDKAGLHCLDVFRKYLLSKGPDNVQSSTRDSTTSDAQSAKVLDVFRKGLLDKWPDHFRSGNHEADDNQQPIHCVTDLKDSGIKFRAHKTDRLWDIQFNNGVLNIPPILIDDGTKPILCNLIAFEQCHPDCELDITNYVAILDDLINSAEDVSYLRRHKIIENWLGSDREVADLVNGLCQEVFSNVDDSHSKLYKEINEHYDRKWNTWRATLKRKYFNNPWAILSLVAAVTLLLLTAAQTFYTVYGYYLPRK